MEPLTPEEIQWLAEFAPPTDPPPTPPGKFADALAGMRDIPFLTGRKYQEQQGRAFRVGAHPKILAFEKRLVRRMGQLGVPMFTHCVWRSHVEQAAQAKAGNSNAKPGSSPHNSGCAADIVHGTRAWNLSPQQWLSVGHVGKEVAESLGVKVVWGGDWKPDPKTGVGWDPAHWELADWRTHSDAFERARGAWLAVEAFTNGEEFSDADFNRALAMILSRQ